MRALRVSGRYSEPEMISAFVPWLLAVCITVGYTTARIRSMHFFSQGARWAIPLISTTTRNMDIQVLLRLRSPCATFLSHRGVMHTPRCPTVDAE